MHCIYVIRMILTTVSYHFAKHYFVLKVEILLYCEEGTIHLRSITFLFDLVCQLTHLSVGLFIHRNY
jgi:hypothetical protein